MTNIIGLGILTAGALLGGIVIGNVAKGDQVQNNPGGVQVVASHNSIGSTSFAVWEPTHSVCALVALEDHADMVDITVNTLKTTVQHCPQAVYDDLRSDSAGGIKAK